MVRIGTSRHGTEPEDDEGHKFSATFGAGGSDGSFQIGSASLGSSNFQSSTKSGGFGATSDSDTFGHKDKDEDQYGKEKYAKFVPKSRQGTSEKKKTSNSTNQELPSSRSSKQSSKENKVCFMIYWMHQCLLPQGQLHQLQIQQMLTCLQMGLLCQQHQKLKLRAIQGFRFQILKDLIPPNDQKRDKASLLLEVIEYIQFLQEKLRVYDAFHR